MTQKENYRQAGRGCQQGRLICPNKTISESPKGFGSTSRRGNFVKEVGAVVGPGQYENVRTFLNVKKESESLKGYGPLTSKNRRLNNKVEYSGPGPGIYNLNNGDKTRSAIIDSGSHRKAAFQQESYSQNLGPGAYDESTMPHYQGKNMAWTSGYGNHAAFRSVKRSLKLNFNLNMNPPVGSYNLLKQWEQNEQKHTPFKNTSSRKGDNINQLRLLSNHSGPPSIIYNEVLGRCNASLTPGPGTYNMQECMSIAKKAAEVQKRCQITSRQNGYVHGLVKHQQKKSLDLPGPGQYYDEEQKIISTPPSVAFKSTVPKSSIMKQIYIRYQNTPGPALYSPSKHTKKSFHLNAKRQFVQSV